MRCIFARDLRLKLAAYRLRDIIHKSTIPMFTGGDLSVAATELERNVAVQSGRYHALFKRQNNQAAPALKLRFRVNAFFLTQIVIVFNRSRPGLTSQKE